MQYCNSHGMAHSTFLSWSTEDRGKALAFEIEKAQRCTMCGSAEWEWAKNKFTYEPGEHFCRGCFLIETAGHERESKPGTRIELMPTTGPAADDRRRKQAAILALARRDDDTG